MSLSAAWAATKAILMDHNSRCWAVAVGAWYIPTGEERMMWDQAEAEKRIKGKSKDYRPWLDRKLDPFSPIKSGVISQETKQAHNRIRELYGITDE